MTPRFVFIWLVFLFSMAASFGQTSRKVLFLGNSYTAYNNLPQLVHDVALSAGDTLIFDSYTPGGYTLEAHSIDPVALGKIATTGWDYMVLQGQSQEPIIQTSVFYQGGYVLVDSLLQNNPCAVSMFYMTWGRKNGDASNCPVFPVMCTYLGMDSTLKNKYMGLADNLNGELSPVSVVWRYLRTNYPSIELYNADESHPSLAGSYAAACCFYATIFKKDPTLITFNSTLNPIEAGIIRYAAKTQVFDQLDLWDYKQLPLSEFDYTIGSGINEILFYPIGTNIWQTYLWDFGDGFTSTISSPTHSYASDGLYTVSLTTTNCDLDGIHTSMSDTTIQFCSHTPVVFATDSFLCEYDTLWTQPADSYQWYSGGIEIPETNQFLPNYHQYFSMGFQVSSTVAGCAELSQQYNGSSEWSGYYFDAAYGTDPCMGGTRLFIVLHVDSLSGSEVIHWYKDGVLLPLPTNMDTLLITDEGAYQCKVIDSLSQCPFDTTVSSMIVIDCTIGLEDPVPTQFSCKVYPNPASEFIILELNGYIESEEISIYNTLGQLIKTTMIGPFTELDISTFPPGHYYIRLKNYPQKAVKFMKQ